MLFRREAGHGLEPVGEMGCALLHRPFLHGGGDGICHRDIERSAVMDGLPDGLVGGFREALAHHGVTEDKTSEQFRYGGICIRHKKLLSSEKPLFS